MLISKHFYAQQQELAIVHLSRHNSVCLSICPTICHTGGSVKNGAS